MTPEQMLENTTAYLKNLEKAKRGYVAVGLPSEEVGGTVYDNGQTVAQVGAQHEYGAGVPRRSFLRTPFAVKKDDMDKAVAKQFKDVFERGKTAEKALGMIGTVAVNIVKGAFLTGGYGEWPDITDATKAAKGSTRILVDNKTLSGSITYVVRGI
jgi:hypothetical protein